MHKLLSNLIIYRDMKGDSILFRMGNIFEKFHSGTESDEKLRTEIFVEIRRLLEVATKYGFDNNLWHNYLTYFIITDECGWTYYVATDNMKLNGKTVLLTPHVRSAREITHAEFEKGGK